MPSGFRTTISRFVALFRRKNLEKRLQEELDFHLEMKVEENLKNGMKPDEAHRQALISFGGLEQTKEACREAYWTVWLDRLWQDFRYGLRTLGRRPSFAIVVVITLALGIGANTAIFSVIDAVLFRPLPFVHPERVVQVWDEYPNRPGTDVPLSGPNFADYRDKNVVFEHITAVRGNDFYTDGTSELRKVSGLHVSADFFAMTGVVPVMGRTFLLEEDYEGAPPVVLLTHGYWQREFGGADVVGSSVSLQQWVQQQRGWVRLQLEIVGVLPAHFEVPPLRKRPYYRVWAEPELVFPMGLWSWGRERRDWYSLNVLAEMKEGVTPEQASSNIQSIAAGIAAANPETNTGYNAVVTPVAQLLTDQYGTALFFLWAATALVLLIVCTNVASLLLVKAVMRERELALRCALGASRLRIFRQLLTESAILGLAGGALGILVAYWGTVALRVLTPGYVLRLDQAGIDLRVLVFTTLISILTVLLCGFAPAWRGSRSDMLTSLKCGRKRGPAARVRLLPTLIVAEVAMSLVLLVGAGLMLRSFGNLVAVDPGFERDNLLLVNIQMPHRQLSKYNNRQTMGQLFLTMRQQLEALPGVMSVAGTEQGPLSGIGTMLDVTMADRPPPLPGERVTTNWRNVSSGYFETVGSRVITGRTFTEEEFAAFLAVAERPTPAQMAVGQLPVVVGEGMARYFWPNENPLGKQFYWGIVSPEELTSESAPFPNTVVGVVADLKTATLAETPPLQWYTLGENSVYNLLVRTSSDPAGLTEVVRRALEAIDPNEITVAQIRTMEQVFSAAAAESRFRAVLVGGFAALAAALTTLGLFGVVGYAVSQRTHEIGVRMSLGARSEDISKMFLGHGLKLSLLGMTIGLLLSFWLSRYISTLLFEVAPTDAVTLVSVAVLICVMALAACYLPVRRATSVDPMEALRQE